MSSDTLYFGSSDCLDARCKPAPDLFRFISSDLEKIDRYIRKAVSSELLIDLRFSDGVTFLDLGWGFPCVIDNL